MAELRKDQELLRDFAATRSEGAFRLLVERHLNLVFATALRRVENPETARDIAQLVFVALARKAAWIGPERSLTAWLHKTTLLEARQWWRSELRRQRREQTALELGSAMKDKDSSLQAMVSALDEALVDLVERDREAVMLRYFQGHSYREIGALFGTGEDAARKRIDKALEQLARYFHRRGYVLPAAGVAAILESANQAAPFGLASAATHAGLAVSGFTTLSAAGLLLAKIMTLTKMQVVAASLALAALPIGYQWRATQLGAMTF